MENYNAGVDTYIAKSADFAKPILIHLRKIVHQAFPDIQEGLKWGFPFFDHKGPVCQMAAFKQHMGFGFWKARLLSDPHKLINASDEAAAGSFGRITSIADLPADNILITYILEAVDLNEKGIKGTMKAKPTAEKKELIMPPEFLPMLTGVANAMHNFDKFSPSKQREYIEWFVEAKTDATKLKRMEQAVEWISEGKSRHWKYQ
jgi:uncharacterized protein YdeI (YjbR/CyaY-like superfamily)